MTEKLTEQDMKIFEFIQNKLGIELNEGQRDLALPSSLPKLCSAVPGSGKTTSLGIAVIAQELIGKIAGNKMYVMTFTNKATNEFKGRHQFYMNKLGLKSYIHVSTIHSMCKRYVELFHEKLGMMKAETLTEEEARKRMQSVISAVFNKKEHEISMTMVEEVLGCIGVLNNKLIFKREEVVKAHSFISLKMDFEKFNSIREIYQSSQRSSGKLGFDEWMLAFYDLLRKHPDIREIIQQQLDAIFVDEFQDTSMLQFEIIRMIKGDNTSLTAVGDADQSIYRWRGASNVYGKFTEYYPNYKHVKMNINYRCPDFVVESANALIRNNTQRLEVKAKGTGKKGKLEIIPTISNQRASKAVAQKIIEDYLKHERDNTILLDKLVLYRNHTQGMFLVYELASKEIPVITSGVTLPHKDKIVRDLLDIIYFLGNPRSSSHTSKCMHMVSSQINKPKVKDKCPFFTSSEKEHFAEIPVNVKDPVKYKKELEQLVNISKMVREGKPAREIFTALLPMYMSAYYLRFRINELMGKTEEDVEAIRTFLTKGIEKNYDIDQFRHTLIKAEQFVNNSNKDQIGVKIFSVHAAKGLEAKEVYLLDVNGLAQPNPKVIQDLKEAYAYEAIEDYINEERSLFYVAITRSLRDLYVTYNKDIPSPFNWESGLNEKLIAKKGILTMESLGIKQKGQTNAVGIDNLVQSRINENPKVNDSSQPTQTKHKLDGVVPKSVLDMLNGKSTKPAKTDADILEEINQITNDFDSLTGNLERRKVTSSKTRLDDIEF